MTSLYNSDLEKYLFERWVPSLLTIDCQTSNLVETLKEFLMLSHSNPDQFHDLRGTIDSSQHTVYNDDLEIQGSLSTKKEVLFQQDNATVRCQFSIIGLRIALTSTISFEYSCQ